MQKWWKRIQWVGAILSCLLWVMAAVTGWINSVAFVSHISMITMVFTFVAGALAATPDKNE